MFTTLLQWDVVQKIVLNTLLVSIPEELFLVMFTLILLGEFDYWKDPECKRLIHSYDYGRILIPTIISALLSNMIRYIGLDFGIISVIPIIVMYIAIVLTNDILRDASALKWMAKAFIFLLLSLITLGIAEFIYVPLVLYSTGQSLQEINNNIFLNFIISLPSRVITYSILLYLISRKRTLLKGNIIKHIFDSSALSILTSIIVVFDLSFIYVMYNLIVFKKILSDISHTSQFTIVVCVIIFPILNILGLFWSVYYVENRAIQRQKQNSENLGILLNNIKSYTNNENYDNIKWKLNEIGMGIEEIAASLYKNDGNEESK